MLESVICAVAVFVVSFLLGSVPWGVIISRFFYGKDLRDEGSGNIGTTNAMRSLGKVGGAAVFILDFGKGILSGMVAVWVTLFFLPGGYTDNVLISHELLLSLSFAGCVWGHIFSPWLGFKGGKGIAVAVGCLFMVYGVIGACLELLIFIVLVVATKYVSLGSVAAAAACPFFSLYYFWGDWPSVILCSLVGLTVVWAHRENIARLRAGTERKIGKKTPAHSSK